MQRNQFENQSDFIPTLASQLVSVSIHHGHLFGIPAPYISFSFPFRSEYWHTYALLLSVSSLKTRAQLFEGWIALSIG